MDHRENINWLKEAAGIIVHPSEMGCADLGSSSCPLNAPAFTRQAESAAEVKRCQSEKLYQFLNLTEYLLWGDLNVNTLASISDAYLWDLAHNSKQTGGKKKYSYCITEIELQKELLILIL